MITFIFRFTAVIFTTSLLLLLETGSDETPFIWGHRCIDEEQGADSVTILFEDAPPASGTIAIGADGFHSAIRSHYYPDEDIKFGGINMWRGVTRRAPFLSGASVVRIGTVAESKMTIYPIREFEDGTQLVN